jgi:hypothetical protein
VGPQWACPSHPTARERSNSSHFVIRHEKKIQSRSARGCFTRQSIDANANRRPAMTKAIRLHSATECRINLQSRTPHLLMCSNTNIFQREMFGRNLGNKQPFPVEIPVKMMDSVVAHPFNTCCLHLGSATLTRRSGRNIPFQIPTQAFVLQTADECVDC